MANKKISDLAAATSVSAADYLAILQGTATKKISLADFGLMQVVSYYVWKELGGNVKATPRLGSGLPAITSGTASAVIQACIDALTVKTGSRGVSGGRIHIARGFNNEVYFLGNELTITGWEGIANTDGVPESQLQLTGDGATQLVQQTAGQNAIVIKNLASVVIEGFRIYCAPNAKSCILGDKNGANSEMSLWRSTLNNLYLSSNSTTSPALYLKNFFAVSVPLMIVQSSANHGTVLENDSTTTNYGNSHFGFFSSGGSNSQPYAGLVLRSTNGNKAMNLLSFDTYENVGGGYYGLYCKGAKFSTFNFVDIEGIARPVYFDGEAGNNETRHIKIKAGYILSAYGGTAITCTEMTGGNDVAAHLQCNDVDIPILDQSNYRPINRFDIELPNALAEARISITRPNDTELTVRRIDGSILNRLPAGTTVATPTAGDSSTKVATTAFVAGAVGTDRRVATWEANGGNTTSSTWLGLPLNGQGTASGRSAANTNVLTRARRVGYATATTANARAGQLGNAQAIFGAGYLGLRGVFGVSAIVAGAAYSFGFTVFDDASLLPSANNSMLHIYADPGDTTWKIRGGGGTPGAAVDTGVPFVANELYDMSIVAATGLSSATWSIKRISTGAVVSGTYAAIPVAGSVVAPKVLAYNYATAAAVSIDIARVVLTTEY